VKREIRDALAIDPIATIPELTERLNKRLNHSFDPRYIKKLTDKVTRQLIVESDRMQIEDRMKVTRENHRIAREELLRILASGAPSKDRVEAAKALVMHSSCSTSPSSRLRLKPVCSRNLSMRSQRNSSTNLSLPTCARLSSPLGRAADCCRRQ
jgi:hypothetical protein